MEGAVDLQTFKKAVSDVSTILWRMMDRADGQPCSSRTSHLSSTATSYTSAI